MFTDTERLDWLIAIENQNEAERILATVEPSKVREAIDEAIKEQMNDNSN